MTRGLFSPFARVTPAQRVVAVGVFWTLVLAGWTLFHHHTAIIPTPVEVARSWVELLGQGLLVRLLESYALNLQAMALAAILSSVFAYASVVGAFRPAAKLVSQLRFLGMTGITFVFGMYFSGRGLQVAMLVFGVAVFYVTSLLSVVQGVPSGQLDHARTLRMGPWRTLWEVVVRGTFDQALDVLRQNAAMGWMMLTMVEGLVRSQGGVGVMLIDQNRRLNLAGVFALQASILAVGIGQDYFLGQLRLLLCPYSKLRER
ncbi:MAG: nitrate ABC transporter permease [Deltaproteobacteria bacterium]|nr:nitrate ABC transporter permease [Deltaproteobacteria bacterium]